MLLYIRKNVQFLYAVRSYILHYAVVLYIIGWQSVVLWRRSVDCERWLNVDCEWLYVCCTGSEATWHEGLLDEFP